MVKLRLKRMGSINKPFYRIVVLDSRKKRDGAYLESLGYYDPKTEPLTLKVDTDRALYWLGVGAQPSDTVHSLLKQAGVMQKFHESRFGVVKSEEKPEEKKKKETVKAEDKPVEKKDDIAEEIEKISAEETSKNSQEEAETVDEEIKVEEPNKESETVKEEEPEPEEQTKE